MCRQSILMTSSVYVDDLHGDHSGHADPFTKITNEFRFNIASFHHAHEAYLVPGVLKKTLVHTGDDAFVANEPSVQIWWNANHCPFCRTWRVRPGRS